LSDSQEVVKERRRRLERASDYDEIFELVKNLVDRTLRLHRAGLSLVLTDMPNAVGAYYPAFSNSIVLNRALVDEIKKVMKDPREVNSFVFVVLLHEYLHSLGYLDDDQVRRLSKEVIVKTLGNDHLALRFSEGNWLEMYPELGVVGRPFSKFFRKEEKFDSSSTPYFG
jgi:hypothetical protein